MPDEVKGQEQSVFVDDETIYNKKTKTVPKKPQSIGIDLNDTVFNNITSEGTSSHNLDLAALESFTQVSQSRDQIYSLLDTMGEDVTVAAVLETYAEDATEYNDQGQIVWAESNDANIAKFVSFLLDSMNVDKNIYKWVYSLCKYGDIYWRLYRESDYDDDILASELKDKPKSLDRTLIEDLDAKDKKDADDKAQLKEDVNIKYYSKNDKYVHYIEMVPNPAEIFELTKFGKTYAYIKAEVRTPTQKLVDNTAMSGYLLNQYRFNRGDVDLHGPTDYVHACLEDNTSRTPEEVTIFQETITDTGESSEKSNTYTVRRGQSLLYNQFKIWRELSLLENSVLLNRLTKSSIVRVVNVEVGDMPKANIGPHLQKIKSLVEQKTAIDTGRSMSEYTNPGPVENNVYIPTHDGKGAITTTQVGGDVNVGDLVDLDYFQDKFFGGLRVPKQYFGITDDNAGFSGGQSLAIISSRYAKMVKRIQNTILQGLTDVINLMLLDKGLNSYVNKFTLHMQPPTTQEEIDRRDNISSKIGITSDIMNMLTDIEDPATRLKILKILLSNVITDPELIEVIQAEIDKLEASGEEEPVEETETDDLDLDFGSPGSTSSNNEPLDLEAELGIGGESESSSEETTAPEVEETEETPEENNLPSPADLGQDFSDNTQF